MRQAFFVAYPRKGTHNNNRAPAVLMAASSGMAEKIHNAPKRATYRQEDDTYVNLEERVPGHVMVNGELTPFYIPEPAK